SCLRDRQTGRDCFFNMRTIQEGSIARLPKKSGHSGPTIGRWSSSHGLVGARTADAVMHGAKALLRDTTRQIGGGPGNSTPTRPVRDSRCLLLESGLQGNTAFVGPI